ncbi:MAG: hypothetical protein H0X38_06200 [Planctomycetes bacterium]|nr:hypothetical protein [Planctomycetota bacterium]
MPQPSQLHRFCLPLLASVVLAGCQTRHGEAEAPAPTPKVWTATDDHAVAQELIDEALKRPWVGGFTGRTGKAPRVALGVIDDRSGGEVDVAVLKAGLAQALAGAHTVQLAEPGTAVDYTLGGAVGAQHKAEGGADILYLQFDISFHDTVSAETVAPVGLEKRRVVPVAAVPAKRGSTSDY